MAFDLDKMFFNFGNVHIISGPNGMCECGKDGKTCSEQLASIASKHLWLNTVSTSKAYNDIQLVDRAVRFGCNKDEIAAWERVCEKLETLAKAVHNKQDTPCYECRREMCGSRGSTIGHCRIFLPR